MSISTVIMMNRIAAVRAGATAAGGIGVVFRTDFGDWGLTD
jgi:hypothetical protein